MARLTTGDICGEMAVLGDAERLGHANWHPVSRGITSMAGASPR